MLKVSAFYLEKQKDFIPKKIYFRPLSISKQKALFTDLIFIEGFGGDLATKQSIEMHHEYKRKI